MTAAPTVWTPKALLDWTEGYLREKGVASPRLDAELLLAHVLDCQRIDLYLHHNRPMAAGELERFREFVRRRGRREPVAYLTGEVGFWTLTLHTTPDILIPSPDTECLVEAVIGVIAGWQAGRAAPRPLHALELGTGGGAIPLAVCSDVQGVAWTGVERSAAALAVAADNRRRHAGLLEPRNNALRLVLGDRFEAIHPDFRPHLIAGNPPYIPSGTIDRLMPEVSRFEPRLALDGGRDGGDFQRYLLRYAARALAPGGHMLLEIGAEQSKALEKAVDAIPELRLVGFHQDLAGHPRVFHVERPA